MTLVELPGCINFRDLGGIPLSKGARFPMRKVFRSGSLAQVGSEVSLTLRKVYGIGQLIDLRSELEIKRDGDCDALRNAGIRTVRLPIEDGGDPLRQMDVPEPADYVQSYLRRLRLQGQQLGTVLRAIANAECPLVFSCTLGKDRTGIVAALLLLACGASQTAVAREYALSAPQLKRSLHLLETHWRRKGLNEHLYRRRIEADEWIMQQTITTWLAASGSLEAALSSLGISKQILRQMRLRYGALS